MRVDKEFIPLDKQIPRFQLDRKKPRKKVTCPSCLKKTLTRYVDIETGEYLPERFGICDRSNSCKYHEAPKGDDIQGKSLFTTQPKVKSLEFLSPSQDIANCIKAEDVLQTIGMYDKNNFAKFLLKNFPDTNLVYKILLRYKIGTSQFPHKNGTIFWQIDENGIVRTGKYMQYDEVKGKRIKEKEGSPPISWVHAFEGSDFCLRQCLFGAHLLHKDIKTYYLVEAEKTALICSIMNPQNIYVACGGDNNLREPILKPLRGKKIKVSPDKGEGFAKWTKKIETDFSDYDIEISDFLEKTDLPEGSDMADYYLQKIIKK